MPISPTLHLSCGVLHSAYFFVLCYVMGYGNVLHAVYSQDNSFLRVYCFMVYSWMFVLASFPYQESQIDP